MSSFWQIFPSLATLEVIILTSSSAASDENLIKMTFLFQGVPVMRKEFPCHDLLMWCMLPCFSRINTLKPRQNGRHFADNIFKCIFLNENVWIMVKISLKFVPKGAINNIPALVQIMAWPRSGYKPLSEPMMVGLPTHICVTRPQWVKKWSQLHQSHFLPPFLTTFWLHCHNNQ